MSDLVNSIDTEYPVLITNHDPKIWCMGAIKQVYENTDFDEYIFLNESMLVKDNSIWKMCFEDNVEKPCMLGDRFLMFLGKFNRNIPEFPEVRNKRDDVLLGEGKWCQEFMEMNPDYVEIQPLKDDRTKIVEIHGEKRMKLENDYFIKWKKHWDIDMIA